MNKTKNICSNVGSNSSIFNLNLGLICRIFNFMNNSNEIEDEFVPDAVALLVLSILGLAGNLFNIFSIILRRSLRNMTNIFILHGCFINSIQCCLFIPFLSTILSNLLERYIKCELLGSGYVTLVTVNLLNMAAMIASEAYIFEDYLQKYTDVKASLENYNNKTSSSRSIHNQSNYKKFKSSASVKCVIFGVIVVWVSSIILHLGITLIGIDSKQFYVVPIGVCFFAKGNTQTFILYSMWFVLTSFSLSFTFMYGRKIYKDVSNRNRTKLRFIIASTDINGPVVDENFYFTRNSHLKNMELASLSSTVSRISDKKDSFRRSFENGFYEKKVKLNHENLLMSGLGSSGTFIVSNRARNSEKQDFKTNKRYCFRKQIIQRINLQFILISCFILCWFPLFIVVSLDLFVNIPMIMYRMLTIVAFSYSSLAPYCYLTILMPCINRCCFTWFRTDGKKGKDKMDFYHKVDDYYQKLGLRFHYSSIESFPIEKLYPKRGNEILF